MQLRSASVGTGYRAKVRIQEDGAVSVSIVRVIDGVETTLVNGTSGLIVTKGQQLKVEGVASGAKPVKVAARAWIAGGTKPAWQQSVTDTSARRIATGGPVRVWGYLSGTAKSAADVAFSSVLFSKTVNPFTTAFTTPAEASTPGTSPSPAPSAGPTPAPTKSPTPTPTPTPSKTPTPTPTPTPAPSTPQPQPSASPTPAAPAAGGQPSTPAPGAVKPSAATTGVPAGTALTRYDGDLTITTPGTVITGLDIHGFVTVKAPDVTISNSIVRGGKENGYALGLITNYGYDNLVIDHVDVVAEFPSVYFDGIKGWDFTARNVHVVGNVDSIKIHGDNVLIENSLLENTVDYASDPAQGGGPTHNDNIQILQGQNLRIIGNTIRGASNFAILGGAEQNNVTLTVDGNWIDGGHCSLKIQVKQSWAATATVTNNQFGPNRKVSSCPFTSYPAVNLTQSGNRMELTGTVVNPLLLVS